MKKEIHSYRRSRPVRTRSLPTKHRRPKKRINTSLQDERFFATTFFLPQPPTELQGYIDFDRIYLVQKTDD